MHLNYNAITCHYINGSLLEIYTVIADLLSINYQVTYGRLLKNKRGGKRITRLPEWSLMVLQTIISTLSNVIKTSKRPLASQILLCNSIMNSNHTEGIPSCLHSEWDKKDPSPKIIAWGGSLCPVKCTTLPSSVHLY